MNSEATMVLDVCSDGAAEMMMKSRPLYDARDDLRAALADEVGAAFLDEWIDAAERFLACAAHDPADLKADSDPDHPIWQVMPFPAYADIVRAIEMSAECGDPEDPQRPVDLDRRIELIRRLLRSKGRYFDRHDGTCDLDRILRLDHGIEKLIHYGEKSTNAFLAVKSLRADREQLAACRHWRTVGRELGRAPRRAIGRRKHRPEPASTRGGRA